MDTLVNTLLRKICPLLASTLMISLAGCSVNILYLCNDSFCVTVNQGKLTSFTERLTYVTVRTLCSNSSKQVVMKFRNYRSFSGAFAGDSLFLLKSSPVNDATDFFTDHYLLHLPLTSVSQMVFDGDALDHPLHANTAHMYSDTLQDSVELSFCHTQFDPRVRMIRIKDRRQSVSDRYLLLAPVADINVGSISGESFTIAVRWTDHTDTQSITVFLPTDDPNAIRIDLR